jgi:hypothetical protein
MNAVQLPDELVKAIVLKSGGSWGDATPEDRQFFSRFAGLVAAVERELCAKVADAWQNAIHDPRYECDCADAIRAREEK